MRARWSAFALLISGCQFGAIGSGVNGENDASGDEDTADGASAGDQGDTGTPNDTSDSGSGGADNDTTPDDGTDGPGEDGTGSDEGSSDGPTAECGNGIPEGDEVCDDGDEDDANGCTTACQESGSVIWTTLLAGDSGAQELLRDVAYHPDEGDFYGVGFVSAGDHSDPLRVTIAPDGDVEVATSLVGTLANEEDRGIAIGPDGEIGVAGYAGGDFAIRLFDKDWAAQGFLSYVGYGWAIAFSSEGVAVAAGADASSVPDDALAIGVGPAWDALWGSASTSGNDDYLRGIAFSDDNKRFYATRNDIGGAEALVQLDSDGNNPDTYYFSGLSGLALRGVTTDGDRVYVSGWQQISMSETAAHVWAFDLDMTEQWHQSWAGTSDLGAFYLDVAVDLAGNVVLVGASEEPLDSGSTSRPIVRKLDPTDGSELWTTLVDIDDNPRGTLTGVDTGEGDMIVATGGVGPDFNLNPVVVALNP